MTELFNIDGELLEQDGPQPIANAAACITPAAPGERVWDGETITEAGVYVGVDMDAYHGDLCDGPSISSSGLRTIEAKSPLHFWDGCYLNPARALDEDTEAMALGRAVHALLSGDPKLTAQFVRRPETLDGKPWQGNRTDCKQWLSNQADRGLTVLLPSQVDAVDGMAERIATSQTAVDMLRGRSERSVVVRDRTGVWLKARPDAISNDHQVCDLKTTADASERGIQRVVQDKGYLMQMALAVSCLEAVGNREIKEAALLFIETKRPHAFNIKPLDNGDVYTAMRLNRRAIDTFAECLRRNDWPTYEDSGRTYFAPQWWSDRLEKDPTLPDLKRGFL